MNHTKDKYVGLFLLHALGDTIGYNNSYWEFNIFDDEQLTITNIQNIMRSTVQIISEFIQKGGITGIDLKNWNVSDDTLINYEIAKFILIADFKNNIIDEKSIVFLKKNLKKLYYIYSKKNSIERGFGLTTIESIAKWDDKKDERHAPFNPKSGGNGCSMRTLPIGLRYYKVDDIDKLIESSLISSKITHNSPFGYLAGVASAFFVSLAVRNVKITEWPFLLIELYESEKIKKYINRDDDNIYFDYRNTVKIWRKFIEMFFSEDRKKLDLKVFNNILSRLKVFIDMNENIEYNISNPSYMPGGNGPMSVIMAYSGLLDCEGNWEKLVYYTMLHGGDSDTVGAIAGGFYGVLYGYKNIPQHLLEHLEMKKELIEIGEKMYENS